MDCTDLWRSQPYDAAILVLLSKGKGPDPRIAHLCMRCRDPELRVPEPYGRGRQVQTWRGGVVDGSQEDARIGVRHTIELLFGRNDENRFIAHGGLKQPARDAIAGERDQGSFNRMDRHGNLSQLIAMWRLVDP